MKRHVLLRRLTEFEAKLFPVKTDAALPAGKKPVTEFGPLSAAIGGVVGSQVGRSVSGKKWNPATNRWEDDQGNPTGAPIAASLAGGALGAGAVTGGGLLHGAVMKNYGGEGGTGAAYGNLGRNVVRGVKTGLANRAAAATAGAASGRQVATDIGSKIGQSVGSAAGGLKTAGEDALSIIKKKLAKLAPKLALNAGYRKRLVELSRKIEGLADKKAA